MAEVNPLKLVDQGSGVGVLAEFAAGDTLPKATLPPLEVADVSELSTVLAGKVGTSDDRLTDAREWTAETVGQVEAEAGTATTRRAWTSQRVRQAIASWWNSISTVFGRGLVGAANAGAGRSALELGTAATRTALGTAGSLYGRDSILGTVSQSGGVPTGAIIERGSNANGEYVRWADGTQICRHIQWTTNTVTTARGNVFCTGSDVWDFPATFAAAPSVSHSEQGGVGYCWTGLGAGVTENYLTTFSAFSSTSFAGPVSVHLIAVGRWF